MIPILETRASFPFKTHLYSTRYCTHRRPLLGSLFVLLLVAATLESLTLSVMGFYVISHRFNVPIKAAIFGRYILARRTLSSRIVDPCYSHNAGGLSPDRPISWYPGHIAKAERELADYIKKVDVVIEVRDARIPVSTTHPMVPQWVGGRPLMVVMLRTDQISPFALSEWRRYYESHSAHGEKRLEVPVFFADGKSGAGIFAIKRHALKFGETVNERRKRHGIQPRAVRAAVIGFPNVGKSALINRLLGRRVAKSQNLPGVTRQLQWVRLGGSNEGAVGPRDQLFELLDSPGIIPAKQLSLETAMRLAMCNDIGEAAYDRVIVASSLCDRINELHLTHPRLVNMERIMLRYKFPFSKMSGDEIVLTLAEKFCRGNAIGGADKVLSDFRSGALGKCSLEIPLSSRSADAQGIKELETARVDRCFMRPSSSSVGGGDVSRGEFDGW
jgi:ribosome biogenesis GTPase A